MSRSWIVSSVVVAPVLGLAALHTAPAQDISAQDIRAEYKQKLERSSLHQRAKAAPSGKLSIIRRPHQPRVFADVKSLVADSKEVLLVHILSGGPQLSPGGDDIITMYRAMVLRRYKGHSRREVTFSVPMGMLLFSDRSWAEVVVPGLTLLKKGGRYLVFLRFARGEERNVIPALRFVGDGIQGALELDDDAVIPVWGPDPVGRMFGGKGAAKLLKEVEAVTRPGDTP